MKLQSRKVLFSVCTLISMSFASHAYATSNIECSGITDEADVSILIGAGPVLNALEASAALNDSIVTTYANDDIKHANIVQFQANDHELSLDLIDDQAEELLASIRLIRFNDDENDPIQVGYIYMPNEPPAAISCEGP